MVKIIRFGLSGNPVTLAHERIVRTLAGMCDQLTVAVCGPRDDKPSSTLLRPEHRVMLVNLGFPNLPDNVILDTADLGRFGQGKRKSTYAQMCLLREINPTANIWLAVGADLVRGGGTLSSEIELSWINGDLLWHEFGFYVIHRPGYDLVASDYPPLSQKLVDESSESSTAAREAAKSSDLSELYHHVNKRVAAYILSHKLYRAS